MTDTAQCITLNALLKEMHTFGVSQIGILHHNFTNLDCCHSSFNTLDHQKQQCKEGHFYSRVKQRSPDTNSKKYFTGENSSQISPTVQLLQKQSFLHARNVNSVPQMDVTGQEKINKLRN